MSLLPLAPSRRRPRAGDLFAFQTAPEQFRHGRVVCTDAQVGPFHHALLVYLYRPVAADPTGVPELGPADLLLPPVLTNQTPWTAGYFETICRRELRPGDVLSRHSFRNPLTGVYFDEYGVVLAEPVEPVGEYSLNLHGAVNALIMQALDSESAT